MQCRRGEGVGIEWDRVGCDGTGGKRACEGGKEE